MGYVHYYEFLEPEILERSLTGFRDDFLLIVEAADVPLDPDITELSKLQQMSVCGLCFTGSGDDGHEPFVIPLLTEAHDRLRYSTKTNQKPYDLTVCVVLLRLKQILGQNIRILSDGHWNEPSWVKARWLYQLLWPEGTISCPWPEVMSDTYSTNAEVTDTNPGCSPTFSSLSTVISFATLPTVAHDPTPFKPELKAALRLLSVCAEESQFHQACIPEAIKWQSLPGVRFRVVDTIHNCIVEPSQIPQYATLSYVWGKNKQLQLLSSNRSKLMSQDAFSKGDVTPSQTIFDAIRVCRILDIRYLWVDALCIVQDEPRDRRMQILRMRRIYSGSLLTIVAACGMDSSSGMRLAIPKSAAHDDNACTKSAEEIYKGSAWNSRGWTLQEAALSHRVLIFTPAGLHFSCQKFAHCANQSHSCAAGLGGQILDLGPEMTFLRNSDPLKNGHSQLEAYFEASSGYSGRELSDPTDLVNAFKGILQCFKPTLDGLKNTFHYALPLSAFDQAFCWQTRWHCPQRRRLGYPSWSWLGWNCSVFWGRQHLSTSLKDRSATLLWPRMAEWRWQREKWELDAQAERGYISHPTLAHQYRDRIVCAKQKRKSHDEPTTFCWGLPVAYELNYQNDRLWIIGSVGRLSVTLTENHGHASSAQFNDRRYKVTVPDTGHEFGTIFLDENWRDSQPVLLRFMLVDGIMRRKCLDEASGDADLVGTHLLCYEHDRNDLGRTDGDDSLRFLESGWRVQLLECQVTESLWRDAGAIQVSLWLT